jgi:hypothetical protein
MCIYVSHFISWLSRYIGGLRVGEPWFDYRRSNSVFLFSTESRPALGIFPVVVKALCVKPQGRGVETRRGELIFSNLPNPSGSTRPGFYWSSNRKPYQKQKVTCLERKARPVSRAIKLAAICVLIV